jgi:GAF domain-containing protein
MSSPSTEQRKTGSAPVPNEPRKRGKDMLPSVWNQWRVSSGLRSVALVAIDRSIAINRADFGCLWLMDWDRRELSLLAHRGFQRSFLATVERVPFAAGTPSALAAYRRRPVFVGDACDEELFGTFAPAARRAGFRSVLSLPMTTARGALVGILSVYFAAPRTRSDRDIQASTDIAEKAADQLLRLMASGRGA